MHFKKNKDYFKNEEAVYVPGFLWTCKLWREVSIFLAIYQNHLGLSKEKYCKHNINNNTFYVRVPFLKSKVKSMYFFKEKAPDLLRRI